MVKLIKHIYLPLKGMDAKIHDLRDVCVIIFFKDLFIKLILINCKC